MGRTFIWSYLASIALGFLGLFQTDKPVLEKPKPIIETLAMANQYPDYFFDRWESTRLVLQCQSNPLYYVNLPPVKVTLQELWNEEQLIDKIGGMDKGEADSAYFAKSIPCHRIVGSQKLIWKVYKHARNYEHRKQHPWISETKVYSSTYGMPVSLY